MSKKLCIDQKGNKLYQDVYQRLESLKALAQDNGIYNDQVKAQGQSKIVFICYVLGQVQTWALQVSVCFIL